MARRLSGSGTGAFVLALLLIRIVFLLAALDPEEERIMSILDAAGVQWSHGPERPLYDREELYAGAAAQAIRERAGIPLLDYRFMSYGGGSLVVSLAAVPVYALFGPDYLAFKIIPLAICVLGGLFWFLAVREWLGRTAAALFGALYALAPPVLVRTALIAKGDHAEAMMILGLFALLATLAARSRDPGRGGLDPRALKAAAAGLVGGIGIFISYSVAPILLAFAATGLLLTRVRPRRLWGAGALGFLAGLLPWGAVLVASHGSALRVYGRAIGTTSGAATALHRFELLAGRGFFASYDVPGIALRSLFAFLWLLAVVVGWSVLLRRIRRPFAALVLAGTAAHLGAFCLLAPDSSPRYIVPAYPLLLAAAASPVAFASRRVLSARGLPFAVLAGGLASVTTVVATSGFPALRAPLSGVDWPLLGEVVGQKVPPERIARLRDPFRAYVWVGFGRRVFYQLDPGRWKEAASLAERDAGRVWEGIGISALEGRRLDRLEEGTRALDRAQRSALVRGLLAYAPDEFARVLARDGGAAAGDMLRRFGPEEQAALSGPLARAMAVLSVEAGSPAPQVPLDRRDLLAGAGWALYGGLRADGAPRLRDPARGSWVPAGPRTREPFVVEGLAAAYRWHLGRRRPEWLRSERGRRRLQLEREAAARVLGPEGARAFARAEAAGEEP